MLVFQVLVNWLIRFVLSQGGVRLIRFDRPEVVSSLLPTELFCSAQWLRPLPTNLSRPRALELGIIILSRVVVCVCVNEPIGRLLSFDAAALCCAVARRKLRRCAVRDYNWLVSSGV